jgi:hypothetical protein
MELLGLHLLGYRLSANVGELTPLQKYVLASVSSKLRGK